MAITSTRLTRTAWSYLLLVGAVVMFLSLIVACGSGQPGNSGGLYGEGGAASGEDQAKPTIRVGSKNFTEQMIVGEMVATLLEQAGYKVERKLNLGGTVVVHQALVDGQLDVYVEYTGTGLTAILDQPAQTDPQQVYEYVKQNYEKTFKLAWLKPWGFNNTYALAMRKQHASELSVEKISDLAGKAGELTFGATQEFITRPDGLPGVQKTYGFEFGDVKGMDPGLMYQALASEQVDVISAFATDGRIPALDLVTLQDDQTFFPPYFAAPVVRQDTLNKAPEIADILNRLADNIDDQTMANLNLQVDEQKKEPGDVALAFLKEQGLVD